MGTLRIRSGNDDFTFEPGRTVRIGRDPASEVVVENMNVSRDHAVITDEGGLWVLRDLESSQGTWRDGRKARTVEIRGTVQLSLGREGRGAVVVLEAAAENADDRSRPGGPVGGVDLSAATDLVGEIRPGGGGGPGAGDPGVEGTVIVGRDLPARPPASVEGVTAESGTVIDGDELRLECGGRSYRFVPGTSVRIGRSEECEVRTSNPTVSRVHAVIEHDGSGWVISDPGSDTGVFRDGGRIWQASLVGSSAVWLGGSKTGERVVLVVARADKRTPDHQGEAGRTRPPLGSGPGVKVLAVVALVVMLLVVLLMVAVVAFVFLARS